MKDNRHKEPRQKPWGQAERIQTGSRLPKTIAREAWVKSKENLIPAKRTNPDSNYAYAQEMEEDSVQQVENCLEDATLLTLQKAGAAYKDRIARKRELHKPHQEGSLYRNTLEPREKETVVREPSKTNPQGTSKQEQQRCTAQKQIEQQVKKVAREIRGVDIDQKQLRTAANTARKGKKAGQVTQRTQRMIYRAKQAAGESAEATKKGIAVIRSAIRHWMTAMQSLAAALIAGGWVSVFIILLMCLIALVAGSAYGIFFAAESPDENAISVQEAVELLTEEYRDRLEEIENSVECDRQKIESNDGSYAIVWQDVLAVFASQTEGDANGTTVAYLNEENVDRLRTVLWDMNELDWRTESQLQEEEQTNEEGETETTTITETVLIIELTHHTPEEMRETYHFTDRQNEYLTLLSGEDTAILWGKLLGGLIQGSDELMAPGMDFEQRTFKDYYNRMLQDAGIGHFTFHALRHTFATRALERGMDYKTLSAILGHYSVSFTMDTYVHSMDEHKRNEMDKMDDLFGISLEISVEQQPYPVLFTVTEEGCKAFAPDFPKIQIQAGTMETALMEAKKQIQKALSQFKYPPIPTRQEDIVVPENSVLILLKTA